MKQLFRREHAKCWILYNLINAHLLALPIDQYKYNLSYGSIGQILSMAPAGPVLVDTIVQAFITHYTDIVTDGPAHEECPICMERYSDLREHKVRTKGVRGCSHTLGLNCLKGLLSVARGAAKRCPFCRTEWYGRHFIMIYMEGVWRRATIRSRAKAHGQCKGWIDQLDVVLFRLHLLASSPNKLRGEREAEVARWEGNMGRREEEISAREVEMRDMLTALKELLAKQEEEELAETFRSRIDSGPGPSR